MTLHSDVQRAVTTGEDSDDLRSYLRTLAGGPAVTHTFVATCTSPGAHRDSAATWFYVEADAAAGVARRRCVACGDAVSLLDSEQHWTFPGMHACTSCGQSMVELAAGLSVASTGTGTGTGSDTDAVQWLALAARCVACGRIEGLTDVLLPGTPLADVVQAV